MMMLMSVFLLLLALPGWLAFLMLRRLDKVLIASNAEVMARPSDIPLELGGNFPVDVGYLHLSPGIARLIGEERLRLKPRPFAPW
jgi:hypothetical protein